MTQLELTPEATLTGKWKPYPDYKDSGVEWLGEIPEQWEMKRSASFLQEKRESIDPKAIDGIIVFHYSIPIIEETGDGQFEDGSHVDSNKLLIRGGELLVSKLNPRKSRILVTERHTGLTICSPEFVVFRPTNCNIKFAFYMYSSEGVRQYLSAHVESATRSHQRVSVNGITKMWYCVPPLLEQQDIVTLLDRETTRINSLIAKKEQLIKLLQEKRAALISHAITKGLDPTVPMKDSGVEWLGEIPAHWQVKRVRDITELLQTGPFGSQLHSSDYSPYGIPVINPSHLKDGQIYADWDCAITTETYFRLERHALRKGDIVFARRGQMGRCALVTEEEAGWLCGTGSLLMRPRVNLCAPSFLNKVLSTDGVRDWLLLESVGTTMDNLNTSILSRIPLPIPALSEQYAIVDYIEGRLYSLSRIGESSEVLIERARWSA